MDDNEIERLEAALAELPDHEFTKVEPELTIAEFCLTSVKEMMDKSGSSPIRSYHVLHAGSLYYVDVVVRAIAPPYEARDPNLSERQWFGQRET